MTSSAVEGRGTNVRSGILPPQSGGAGMQPSTNLPKSWIPASAGMTIFLLLSGTLKRTLTRRAMRGSLSRRGRG